MLQLWGNVRSSIDQFTKAKNKSEFLNLNKIRSSLLSLEPDMFLT